MDSQTIKRTLAPRFEITKEEYDKAKTELSTDDFTAQYLLETVKN